ncbi:AraC family transcriptional regulator [Oleiagrimonas sp. C23AA]|uniref:AraC family transcriptional regulator n=1 Tax=Oleiagrimonas sp. C23AA TaxID=2719047 RepID=UPI0014228748|nr:AraC family transcriptional regulator [Oleiagrimonas sp. C23AA]NII09481.1 AraC family transcriptional regulator [Oleiagrimonas sp. C23AA]
MDPLSDLLALLKPKSYLTAGLDAGGGWAVRFENQPGAIKCYAIMDGECWLVVDGEREVRLLAEDCVIVPNARSFTLASDLGIAPVPARDLLGTARAGEMVVHQGGGDFRLIGTRFEVDGRKAQSLLGALPALVHLRGATHQDVLRWSIRQLMFETGEARPGSSLAAHHLAHFILLQAFRLYLSQHSEDRVGMLYALSDVPLARAIKAMHADPAHPWTLPELARRSGVSRSSFAQRFRDRVGETPIAYLTHWRMLLAAERLETTGEPLAQVARAYGYDSENAFSAAFKRVMGCSPGRYARMSDRAR